MATTDQFFTVYGAAQKAVSAYLQAHNSYTLEAGDPLVAATIALNDILNALPEFATYGVYIPFSANTLLTTYGGNTPQSGAVSVKAYLAPDKSARFKLPSNATVMTSAAMVPLVGGASVKGVVDNTITKCTMSIDTNGTVQSVTLTV